MPETLSKTHQPSHSLLPGTGKTVSILGVPLSFGQSMAGVDMGPSAIRVAGLAQRIATLGYEVNDRGDIRIERPHTYPREGEKLKYLTEVHAACSELAEQTEKMIVAGELPITIGGFTMTEVHTDQGLVGLGPGFDPQYLKGVQNLLVGKDPFDMNRHAAALYAPYRDWGAPVEIALWDLLGKIVDQPLYKVWGGTRDKVLPYAAMWGVGTPEERADMSARIKAEGWKAIKLRAGFTTLRDDVKVVELVRKTVGDDFHILVDGNKAPGDADAAGDDPTLWNFKRAVDTAREYQRLKVYWLEEPLPRYALKMLGELNRLVEMPMAGGEANWGIHEFRDLLDEGCFDILMPEVMRLQLAHGITKFKCATISEAEMGAVAGAEDILLAYQPVGPNIDRLLELSARFPSVRFSCVADNAASIGDLSDAAARASTRLEVLLDLDIGQHRTGVAPDSHAFELYRLIASLPALAPGGLHAYDGHIHNTDVAERTAECEAAFAPVEVLRRKLEREKISVPRVITSGTPTFPMHAAREGAASGSRAWRLATRSG